MGGLICQETWVATNFHWAQAHQRFRTRSQGVTAAVSLFVNRGMAMLSSLYFWISRQHYWTTTQFVIKPWNYLKSNTTIRSSVLWKFVSHWCFSDIHDVNKLWVGHCIPDTWLSPTPCEKWWWIRYLSPGNKRNWNNWSDWVVSANSDPVDQLTQA